MNRCLLVIALALFNSITTKATAVHAVIDAYDTYLEVSSPSKYVKKVFKRIRVLDKQGERHATLVVGFDRFSKISKLSASITDAKGNEIKSLKKSDFAFRAGMSDNLYDDFKLLYYTYTPTSFPFTIEFSYEKEYKQTIMYDTWMPINSYHTEVQEATMVLTYPKELAIRTKALNLVEAEIVTQEGLVQMTWKVDNQAAIEGQVFEAPSDSYLPTLYVAPTHFEYDGSEGNITDWDDFGRWMNGLLTGLDDLSEDTKAELDRMKKEATSARDLVKKVYQYVQGSTRYVSVQLGIGGWQPFPASYVEKNGFGDCKALTNYTKALLTYLEIPSLYAVIGAGDHASIRFQDFPSLSQANHVILCVPMEQDSVWLECTSQQNPFGYLGTFTSNRKALLIHNDGASIVKTPFYDHTFNIKSRHVHYRMDNEGNIEGSVHIKNNGVYYRDALVHASVEDQLKKLKSSYSYTNISFSNIQVAHTSSSQPKASESFDFVIPSHARQIGKRTLIQPLLFVESSYIPKMNESRDQEVYLQYGYQQLDSIRIDLPERMALSKEYAPISIDSPFGSYQLNIQKTPTGYLIVRKRILRAGTYPASSYMDICQFYKTVNQSDAKKWLLESKT